MRLAKQSTLIVTMVASLTTLFVGGERSIAQQIGSGTAVVRPADDDLPFAPPSQPAATGSLGESVTSQPMPSQFLGLTEDTVIWPARTFAIPFNVETTGKEPVEVQLFVARGPGNQWRMIDQKPSTLTEFPFEATDDGLYWFATRTMSGDGDHGKIANAGSTQPLVPQLKIFVDSARPDVTLIAEADESGLVTAQVGLDDSTPLRSIQLHYVTDTLRQWQSLDVDQMSANGDLTFQPTGAWQQLSLQAVVTDSAGHQGIVSKLLQRPRVAAITRSNEATSQTAQYRTAPIEADSQSLEVRAVATPIGTTGSEQLDEPTDGPVERIAANPFWFSDSLNGYRAPQAQGHPAPANPHGPLTGSLPPSLSPMTAPVQANQPPSWQPQGLPSPASPDQVTNGFAGPITSAAPETPSVPRSTAEVQKPAQAADRPVRPRTIADAMRPISDKPKELSGPKKLIESIPAPMNAERDPAAEKDTATPYEARKLSSPEYDSQIWDGRVPTRYSDSFRFSLDYELEAVGANGAESIELWGSTDAGKSWERWGSDPDLASPFDIETKDEGMFGFRIVVLGRNGLTTPRPLQGETPDIVIVVDKVKPDVRITGASYGEGDRAGSLVIQYACTDTNLMQRPITLAFSDTPDGPWTTIAAGLQNNGDYVWPADPQLPRRLYLRIDATDRAGNVGSYVLDRAIDAQGLAPRARIRGFQTLSGPVQPTSDGQTAALPKATFQ